MTKPAKKLHDVKKSKRPSYIPQANITVAHPKLPKPTFNYGRFVVVVERAARILYMWGGYFSKEEAKQIRDLVNIHRDSGDPNYNLKNCTTRIARGMDHPDGSTV